MNGNDDRGGHAKSPLKTDNCGRFSRKGKVVNKLLPFYPYFDDMFAVIFSFFLIAIDFVLFSGSGNISIFENSVFPIPEVSLILGVFFLIMAVIMVLLHKIPYAKAVFSTICAFIFIFVIYKQFSQLHQSIGFGNDAVSVSVFIGAIFSLCVFWVYAQPKILYKICLTIAPVVLFFNICSTLDEKDVSEFVVSTNSENYEDYAKNERLIYFILPDFLGHNQIKSWNIPEATATEHLAEGFYQNNKFTVFNNAYVETYDYFNNLIMLLNPKAKKETINNYILNTQLLSGHWKFSNLIYNNINLKENELYDYLSYQGYQISAYKSRNIDLCRKNHQLNVQRCVEKVNQPTNISDLKLSLFTRAKVLFMEWFFSLKLGNMQDIAESLKLDDPQQISIVYNNLYVMNSLKFFDILFDNIKEDTGKQAYFVFADIPSDMYIYDEFCQIKNKDQWMDRVNLPWIMDDYTYLRKSAYLQQYRCLYGKLQQFMDKMNERNLLDTTKIVLMGASNVNNFQNTPPDDYIEKFLNNNLVNLAVYNGKNKQYQEDNTICPVVDLITQQLFGFGQCGELTNLHEQTLNTLKQTLINTNNSEPENHGKEFSEWYENWKKHNE